MRGAPLRLLLHAAVEGVGVGVVVARLFVRRGRRRLRRWRSGGGGGVRARLVPRREQFFGDRGRLGFIFEERVEVGRHVLVAQCQQHCLDTDGCDGFEYGVDHGGSSDTYPPGSCFPQASADSAGCDGVLMNLDLYLLDSPCNGANYNLDMYIINEQVVNNDGNHGFEEKDGTVSLTAGVHFITVTYFENRFSEELQVKWTPTP